MFIGGGFEIPIFDRKQGEIKKAEAEFDYLLLEKEALLNEFEVSLRRAIANFKIRKKQYYRLISFDDSKLEEKSLYSKPLKFRE